MYVIVIDAGNSKYAGSNIIKWISTINVEDNMQIAFVWLSGSAGVGDLILVNPYEKFCKVSFILRLMWCFLCCSIKGAKSFVREAQTQVRATQERIRADRDSGSDQTDREWWEAWGESRELELPRGMCFFISFPWSDTGTLRYSEATEDASNTVHICSVYTAESVNKAVSGKRGSEGEVFCQADEEAQGDAGTHR